MDAITSFATTVDSAPIVQALRRAETAWRSSELEQAVRWVEKAAAIAAAEGRAERAIELALRAEQVHLEVKRRSGIPDRSDPAWHEARRLQSSLIEVRDSWLDPVELDERGHDAHHHKPARPKLITLDDDELELIVDTPARATLAEFRETVPDLEAGERARKMREASLDTNAWQDEAPTLPRTCRQGASDPISERDTVRPPLGSLNELTLLAELERAGAPGTRLPSILPTVRLRDATERGLDSVLGVLRAATAFEDLPDNKREDLALAGSIIRLAGPSALDDYHAAVVIDGSASVMQRRGGEALRAEVGDAICFDVSVPNDTRPRVLASTAATVAIAWKRDTLDAILAACPWVVASMRARADELATLSAIGLRQVARKMGTAFRNTLVHSARLLVLPPGGLLIDRGAVVRGLTITGAGHVELLWSDGTVERVEPGTVLFAREMVAGVAVQAQARAGGWGATALHVDVVEAEPFLPHVPLLERALSARD